MISAHCIGNWSPRPSYLLKIAKSFNKRGWHRRWSAPFSLFIVFSDSKTKLYFPLCHILMNCPPLLISRCGDFKWIKEMADGPFGVERERELWSLMSYAKGDAWGRKWKWDIYEIAYVSTQESCFDIESSRIFYGNDILKKIRQSWKKEVTHSSIPRKFSWQATCKAAAPASDFATQSSI